MRVKRSCQCFVTPPSCCAIVDRLYAHSSVPFLDFSISKNDAHAPCFAQLQLKRTLATRAAVLASALLKFCSPVIPIVEHRSRFGCRD